ncbi:MAG TPA: thrombospondin type 3 repeat-containing protein [Candidatus Polarisedimenticolia bacterium]|nr:thrombospondin type 3 repeat-containing protein [Candidatus Polarisedimenticolia bacterium]
MRGRSHSDARMVLLWLWLLAVSMVPARDAHAQLKVGAWLEPEAEFQRMLRKGELGAVPPNPDYPHIVNLSTWRQVGVHSSIVALGNYLLGDQRGVPWSVFEQNLTYQGYLSALAGSPASQDWLQRIDTLLKQPLLSIPGIGDKTILFYSHMFGYDSATAVALGYPPRDDGEYAWPLPALDGTWPAEFYYAPAGGGQPHPSLHPAIVQTAYKNLVYFLLKHFEGVGARRYFVPWREVNLYNGGCAPTCGIDPLGDLIAVYSAIVQRIAQAGDLDLSRVAIYETVQLQYDSSPCVLTGHIDLVKRFYQVNQTYGVNFQIGISSYPGVNDGDLTLARRRLKHLLDSLYATSGVPCDADNDGTIDPGEGFNPSQITTPISVPVGTPLSYPETGRPSWKAIYYPYTDHSIRVAEERGGAHALDILTYQYRTPNGLSAYPLDNVVFEQGTDIVVASSYANAQGSGVGWLHFSAGLNRDRLTSGQPKPAALLIDSVLDPDNDWDNDGVMSIKPYPNPFTAKREANHGLDDVFYRVVPTSFPRSPRSLKQRIDFDHVAYRVDNCPYAPNASQADADGDGIGDACDNCTNVANYIQTDWDQDGYGNACDADLDENGQVTSADRNIVAGCQGGGGMPPPVNCLAAIPGLDGRSAMIADLDDDEDVDAADVAVWDALAASPSLRVSGLSCAGSIPCPNPAVVMLPTGQVVTIPGP